MTGPPCEVCGGELRVATEPAREEEGTVKTVELLLVCGWCGAKFECPK